MFCSLPRASQARTSDPSATRLAKDTALPRCDLACSTRDLNSLSNTRLRACTSGRAPLETDEPPRGGTDVDIEAGGKAEGRKTDAFEPVRYTKSGARRLPAS